MNRQHFIDNAVFDTRITGQAPALAQQTEIEEFVKNRLIHVVDEVLGGIDNDSSRPDSILSIDNLEIDIGEIPFADYRQQMPRKLREHLQRALSGFCGSTTQGPSDSTLVDRVSAGQVPLFYFLAHGCLPSDAPVADADALERLLSEMLDATPARLAGFISASARGDRILQRLQQQFSTPLVQRVMRLMNAAEDDHGNQAPSPTRVNSGSRGDPVTHLDALSARLVSALLAGDSKLVVLPWQALYTQQTQLLEKTLRYYGQRQAIRRFIATSFPPARFAQLLRLLEPGAHGFALSLLQRSEIFASNFENDIPAPPPSESRLREYTLTYLLVERGDRFDQRSFLVSLMRQLVAAAPSGQHRFLSGLKLNIASLSQSGKLAGDLSQPLLEAIDEMAGQPVKRDSPASVESYRQYRRLKAALTRPGRRRHPDSVLLADIAALVRYSPWLVMRLLRDLQSGSHGGAWPVENLSAELLAGISHAFLSLSHQADAAAPPAPRSELIQAIQANAARSRDRHAFFAHILDCLIKGELIDFDAIGAGQCRSNRTVAGLDANIVAAALNSDDSEAAGETDTVLPASAAGLAAMAGGDRDRLLRCAELLTTAVYFTETRLTAEQLEAFQWQFLQTHVAETGPFFNEGYFVRRYLDSLMQQVGREDTREFLALLGQALLQNSLPSTLAMTRRILKVLADTSTAAASGSAAKPGEPARGHSDPSVKSRQNPLETPADEVAPLQDIYIANAGAVLIAPYLPRLFAQLGLTEDGDFKNRDAAERAVHGLQFLVNESVSSPEYQLVLNKILCGIKPGRPIRRRIELLDEEIAQLEGLLHAVTRHWKALANTSIAGLRESFLQRQGRLQLRKEAWHLSVEGKSFDLLLDQIPWSYSTIKFPWMDRVIYVEWR